MPVVFALVGCGDTDNSQPPEVAETTHRITTALSGEVFVFSRTVTREMLDESEILASRWTLVKGSDGSYEPSLDDDLLKSIDTCSQGFFWPEGSFHQEAWLVPTKNNPLVKRSGSSQLSAEEMIKCVDKGTDGAFAFATSSKGQDIFDLWTLEAPKLTDNSSIIVVGNGQVAKWAFHPIVVIPAQAGIQSGLVLVRPGSPPSRG
ncbi:MAG: hypothetical protein ABGW84_00945 [Sphingomonadaceae bacterium]